MKSHFSIKLKFLILMMAFGLHSFSQDSIQSDFYKHFIGKLDTSMNLTVDILSQNGIIKGYYYYLFIEPGTASEVHYGKTISVSGNVTGSKIKFSEFSNPESKFTGDIINNNEISGFWQRSSKDRAIPFNIKENYDNGSIPLTSYSVSDEHYLFSGDGSEKSSPKAKFQINLIFPEKSDNSPAIDSLNKLISGYLLHKKSIDSPEQFIQRLKHDYFDSYIKSSEGIADISKPELFNREKKISMQVAYNENHLLSMIFREFAKTGNSSGLEMSKYFVFSSSLKSKLLLKDIITDEGLERIDVLLNKKLRNLNGIESNESLVEAGFFSEKIVHNNNFYINNDGIGFLYNIYEIAPGSYGITSLFIEFEELNSEIIKPGILTQFQ